MKQRLLLLFLGFLFFIPSNGFSFGITPSDTVILCDGESAELKADAGYSRYLWSTGAFTQSIKVSAAGTYKVTAYDRAGKKYQDSVVVVTRKSITVKYKLSPSNKVCEGDSLTISITSPKVKYEWSDGGSKSSISFKPKTGGSVWVYTTDSNGCRKKTFIQYSVIKCNDSCSDVIDAEEKVLCSEKDEVTIEAKKGYTKYNWKDGSKDRVRKISKAGTYILTVTDSLGNTCTDSIKVILSQKKLVLESDPDPAVICPGDYVKFTWSRGFKSYAINEGKKDGDYAAKWFPSKTGSFVLEAEDDNGCVYREELKVTVKDTCDDCDDLIGDLKKTNLCGRGDSVILEASTGWTSYEWNTGDKGRTLKVTKKGWYIVTALDKDKNECKDSVYIGSATPKKLVLESDPNPAVICPGDYVYFDWNKGFREYAINAGKKDGDYRAKWFPARTGSFVLEAIDSNGCEARAEVKVTIKDTCKDCSSGIEEAWPSNSFCENDSIKIQGKTGHKKYKWSTGSSDRLIYVKKPGWYILEFQKQDGSWCKDSIYLKPGKTNQKLTIETNVKGKYCKGDTIEIWGSKGFDRYGWNIIRQSKREVEYVLTSDKEIVLEAIDSNGCAHRATYKIELDSCTLGMMDVHKTTVQVFPNPASSSVKLTSSEPMHIISITSAQGKIIQEVQLNARSANLDLTGFAHGIYWITIQTDQGIQVRSIIKQ
jgi:hypothetical protein